MSLDLTVSTGTINGLVFYINISESCSTFHLFFTTTISNSFVSNKSRVKVDGARKIWGTVPTCSAGAIAAHYLQASAYKGPTQN